MRGGFLAGGLAVVLARAAKPLSSANRVRERRELFGRAELAAGGTATTKPGHEHRVELGRRRGVDQFVEQLVVPGRRQLEYLEDLAFFGAVRSPQAPFKCEDAHFEIGQRGHRDFGLSPPRNMVCHWAV
jgi:hypothetical protein